MFVDGSRGGGSQLTLLLALLLYLCYLLPLGGGSRDLHAEDDVTDLGLSEGGHVYAAELRFGEKRKWSSSWLSFAGFLGYFFR